MAHRDEAFRDRGSIGKEEMKGAMHRQRGKQEKGQMHRKGEAIEIRGRDLLR